MITIETRVYLIPTTSEIFQYLTYYEISDERFMGIAERHGNVYTTDNFQDSVLTGLIDLNKYRFRIINIVS